MSFLIVYTKLSSRFLSKCDRHIAARIMDKLDAVLSETPVPQGAK